MDFSDSKTTGKILTSLEPHPKLNIRIGSPKSLPVSKEVKKYFFNPHRKTQYFFLFIRKGRSIHTIDLKKTTVAAGQVLFVLPHQIHIVPSSIQHIDFFKVTFSESCLAMLPRKFSFLLDPRNNQLIDLNTAASKRILKLFELLESLLLEKSAEIPLLLSNLNTLLTEFEIAYFKPAASGARSDGHDVKLIEFKSYIEEHLTKHPSIRAVSQHLGLSVNKLYLLVNHQIGCSPKEYILRRLILEAQRRLFYTDISIKELANSLGFNDPDYFSKLFKKRTGKSISTFLAESHQITGDPQ